MSARIPTLFHEIELRHARRWIGRRLVLRQRWLGFDAGTACVVTCVVDFGDGLLFWISTDEAEPRDIDQVTRRELETCFELADVSAFPGRRRGAVPRLQALSAKS
ncbi:MAG TPA: hypothetical protein VK973_09950 [Arenicellales bacterium]|nr:hypothetical protein [Arenicellales bacterium]